MRFLSPSCSYDSNAMVRMRYSINGDAVTNDSWGTSFSSPILAAMFALLNGELIQAGKPVLGFLNPWLYSHPEMFNDITSGQFPLALRSRRSAKG